MSVAIIMMIAAVIVVMMGVRAKEHPVNISPTLRKELATRVKAHLRNVWKMFFKIFFSAFIWKVFFCVSTWAIFFGVPQKNK